MAWDPEPAGTSRATAAPPDAEACDETTMTGPTSTTSPTTTSPTTTGAPTTTLASDGSTAETTETAAEPTVEATTETTEPTVETTTDAPAGPTTSVACDGSPAETGEVTTTTAGAAPTDPTTTVPEPTTTTSTTTSTPATTTSTTATTTTSTTTLPAVETTAAIETADDETAVVDTADAEAERARRVTPQTNSAEHAPAGQQLADVTVPLPEVDPTWQLALPRPRTPGRPGASAPAPGRVAPLGRWTPGDETAIILATIRHLESGARYDIGPNAAEASGAYQYIPSTWQNEGGYPHAYLAPPAVQDARARADVERLLARWNNDVSMIPVLWYYPKAANDPLWMDRVPNPSGGNRLTVREYQTLWLATYTATRAAVAAQLGGSGSPSDAAGAAAPLAPIDILTTAPSTAAGPTDAQQASTAGALPAVTVGPVTVDARTVGEQTAALAARSRPPQDLAPPALPSDVPHEVASALRSISFPVLGPSTYSDTWGACRDGCHRSHEGTDIIGVPMQPLLAVVDGTVVRARHASRGISGVAFTIQDADGWRYNYFHLNNDTPGGDDDIAAEAWRIAPGLEVGDHVRAGEIIGYMGDSGNAEGSLAHLHFEIRDPFGVAHPSYWSLAAAHARQACSIGIGPWSTPELRSPADSDGTPLAVETTTVTPLFGTGVWQIDNEGRVTATGDAALIVPSRALTCMPGPTTPFGTDAAGWTTSPTTDLLAGTVLDGIDVMDTALAGVLPAPPVEATPAPRPGRRAARAALAPRPVAFVNPATGETILVVDRELLALR